MIKSLTFLAVIAISSVGMVAIAETYKIQSAPVETLMTVICMSTADMAAGLKREYNELPVIIAKTTDINPIEYENLSVWLSDKQDTITILATKGDVSCMLTSGKDVVISKSLKYN
jgi:hypothetical protein